MAGIRHFTGSREYGKNSIASQMMRFELSKKGKLDPTQRYKMIMKQKFEENRSKALLTKGGGMQRRKLSKRAEQAMKELAMKKAIKRAREMRKMVIVTPRQYQNGKLDKKGKIYDVAGNVVGQVNLKNGRMTTNMGTPIGNYKAKSMRTDSLIQDSINKYSPYMIQQRKLQALQQEQLALLAAEQGGVWGASSNGGIGGGFGSVGGGVYGQQGETPRFAAGVTAWGAMSDNVHGTFTDNAWGTMADNVWGTTETNVWGGFGVGGMWGVKGPKIWGTGSGKNFIKGITNAIAGLFGFGFGKQGNSDKLKAFNAFRGAGSRGGSGSGRGGSGSAPARGGGGRR
ncbi:MAG: hypothetical protein SFT92_04380 [Rickettsiales bacterium]|nr:hypothetical protein [Rickettsiales bacterium]